MHLCREELERIIAKENEYNKKQKTQAAALLAEHASLGIQMAPWGELSTAQMNFLREVLANQRKFHILNFLSMLNLIHKRQEFKTIELDDVRNFLKLNSAKVTANRRGNKRRNATYDASNKNESKEKAILLQTVDEKVAPSILKYPFLMLTTNNCIRHLENSPRDLFIASNILTSNAPVSILSRARTLQALMSGH